MTSILTVSCSSALSDTEFAEEAQETCQISTENIDKTSLLLDYGTKSEIYSSAADALNELEFTAESAPQGYRLQASLAELATAYEQFDQALQDATQEACMGS